MRLSTVLILAGLTTFLIGCSATASRSVCPRPNPMPEAAKDVLRRCCTVLDEAGDRRQASGTGELWNWLAGQASINAQLEACRR